MDPELRAKMLRKEEARVTFTCPQESRAQLLTEQRYS